MDESKKKDRYEDAKKFVRYSDGGIGEYPKVCVNLQTDVR